jgi:hypothetical protein
MLILLLQSWMTNLKIQRNRSHHTEARPIPDSKNEPIATKKKLEKENHMDNLRMEALFWKDKYHSTVPILQSNLIDLELENQQLNSRNKNLIAEYEEKIVELKRKLVKTEGSIAINSPGVNIFVNSDFKNFSS